MFPEHLRFARLKRLVSIEHVLAQRGLLSKLRCRGDMLVGPCPIHHGDNPRAFVVSRNKNLWRCFTACDAGGDVVEFVRRLDKIDYPRVAFYLASLADAPPPPSRRAPLPTRTAFTPFPHRLRLDPHVDFLRHKAIQSQTASFFEVGFYSGRGFLHQSIGVRLHDLDGNPLGYAARRLHPQQARTFGKWKFPPRLPKNQLLYNFHRVRPIHHRPLVIVECPWGVMRLHQLAIPSVALLGTHLSAPQQSLLLEAPRLIVLMDADRAGRKAASRISQKMSSHSDLLVASIPTGLDPDDLSDEQLATTLRPFL